MACFALVIPWISPPQLSENAWHASLALSVLTLVELPFALVLFGKRAAWFLVSRTLLARTEAHPQLTFRILGTDPLFVRLRN